MNIVEIEKLDRVSRLLVARAEQMGVTGFSVRSESLALDDAMDQEGPLAWALFMHSSIISKMAGIEGMPFECVTDSESLFGNRAGIKAAGLPLSFASHCLDAALEHAVVVGLRDIGCSREEWEGLPDHLRVLPVEAYFQDLKANWVDESLEVGSIAEKVVNWPVLLDFSSYEESLGKDHAAQQVNSMKLDSIVPFTPKH